MINFLSFVQSICKWWMHRDWGWCHSCFGNFHTLLSAWPFTPSWPKLSFENSPHSLPAVLVGWCNFAQSQGEGGAGNTPRVISPCVTEHWLLGFILLQRWWEAWYRNQSLANLPPPNMCHTPRSPGDLSLCDLLSFLLPSILHAIYQNPRLLCLPLHLLGNLFLLFSLPLCPQKQQVSVYKGP